MKAAGKTVIDIELAANVRASELYKVGASRLALETWDRPSFTATSPCKQGSESKGVANKVAEHRPDLPPENFTVATGVFS